MNRIVVIYHDNDSNEMNVVKMMSGFASFADTIYVATPTPNEKFNSKIGNATISNVYWPSDADNQPKRKNWIRQFIKGINFTGFLHIVEDTVEILDLTPFIDDIEHTMTVLDYDVWTSTCSDPCNYVYDKFNPRLAIKLDTPELMTFGIPTIYFTSHSNTCWEIFNYAKISDNMLTFDERFSVAMFYIIEYFARRRNNKKPGELYYMNQYMTIDSERNAYRHNNVDDKKDLSDVIKAEDPIFKEMNINFMPDNNIDMILEDIYAKLRSKLI